MVGRRVSYLGGQSKNFFKEGASKNVATKCFLEHAVKPVNNTLYDKKTGCSIPFCIAKLKSVMSVVLNLKHIYLSVFHVRQRFHL